MSTLREKVVENYRLAALRLLAEAAGYRANDSLLHSALRHLGFEEPRDVLVAELAWLERHQLITIETPIAGLSVATLTRTGEEVATGLVTYPGVKRPLPKG